MFEETESIKLLEKIIRISNSTVDIERRLFNLLDVVSLGLGADMVSLFSLDPDGGDLGLKLKSMNAPSEDIGRLTIDLDDNFVGLCSFKREPIILTAQDRGGPDWPAQPFFQPYRALAALPVMDDQYLYGVMVLKSLQDKEYAPGEIHLLQIICREIAGALRNNRHYEGSKKRITELSMLYEISRAVTATIELDKMLDSVVTISARMIMAEGCALNIVDMDTGRLKMAASFGVIPPACQFKHLLEEDNALADPGLKCCISREKVYAGPAGQDPECAQNQREEPEKSVICLPLKFKSHFKGTLSLYNKRSALVGQRARFSVEERDMAATMGAMIVNAIENALTFQTVENLGRRNQALVRSLSSLYEISSALMNTVRMDEILGVIAKALTHQRGMNFDRALIFLVDEEREELRGAAKSDLSAKYRNLEPGSLVDALSINKPLSKVREQALKQFLSARVSIGHQADVLVKTLLAKKPLQGQGLEKDWGIIRAYDFGRQPFAVVPMMAKDKVLGVFAVDRAYQRRRITIEDMRNLTMLANQAGLAIENSNLYNYIEHVNQELSSARERLLEAEKLAALGEMAAGMAHEIRNPLVSIGGFTRRIIKIVGDDTPIKKYIQVIYEEVTRLEKTLNEILDFSRDANMEYDTHNLNEVVRESLYLLKRDLADARIKIDKKLASDLPPVYVDIRQIKHVFYNLFLNACQAMPKGGRLDIETYLEQAEDRTFAACRVSDTGSGIPAELLPNIFNPFFTTKTAGTGLGLSIVHNILSRHGGEIDVFNRPDQGATFVVKLPITTRQDQFIK